MTAPASGEAGSLPMGSAARERLRDQHQQETRHLDAVLAAHTRVLAERQRAEAMVRKAERAVGVKQQILDDAVLALIDSCGLPRAAVLLDRPAGELAGLQRSRRRDADAGRGGDHHAEPA